MDDEDDAPSRSPSPSPSPSLSPSLQPVPVTVSHRSSTPPIHAHLTDSVTVAVAGPVTHHQTLTLALPIQNPLGSGNGGGGGRDDCWSEGATSALIDAWGERFVELSRGNLKQKHWQEVADVVSSRDDYSKPPRTDIQCKNRIDTLKRKYKLEKTKIVSGPSASSSWTFFHRLDVLLGPSVKPSSSSAAVSVPKQPPPAAVATAALSQFPQKQRTNIQAKRKASSPAASASSTSDSFTPAPPPPSPPPPAVASANGRKGLPVAGLKELTRAILKFGEVYQRIESSKLQQAMEMEQRRMGFAQDLEMQRMQFFTKTQMELSQLKLRRTGTEAGGRGGGRRSTGGISNNHHHGRRHHHQILGNNHDYGNEKRG